MITPTRLAAVLLVLVCACRGCGKPLPASRTLTLGAYTTPREVYTQVLIPTFERQWREQTGKTLRIRPSFLGSGAQARAIVGGFAADVAALSLAADIETLEQAKLVPSTWRQAPHGGIVSRSLVVIGVRAGNPHGIRGWDDLAKPGIAVLTPNPRTSGGALWNLAAIWGAAWRGHTSAAAGDEAAAEALLRAILRNVKIMDRSARDSTLTFERGVGDAIISYENEMLVGQQKGQQYTYVVPPSTVVIENPVAIVEAYARKHGVMAEAQAFVDFLYSDEAQRALATKGGLRPVSEAVAAQTTRSLPQPADAFRIDELGGWQRIRPLVLRAAEP